ncbi:hypothetical protein UCRPA7_2204 [Phaeoacremonium minimum UCRPA7]|uniref:Uncharacterized protein n=1 Tax=Phaeoacremonium minimum (strain UCR-PA7) TaxID=1286976 RepID=R8BSH8_PHAM7|nr:hypothetical protein UCRPA7_2204 [Phaeoacremonium minimum UCRPA7]EOO02291.1 hypothetical protein UCRPA7_2204 [Phaeoacremonium minimum UCRPA7]
MPTLTSSCPAVAGLSWDRYITSACVGRTMFCDLERCAGIQYLDSFRAVCGEVNIFFANPIIPYYSRTAHVCHNDIRGTRNPNVSGWLEFRPNHSLYLDYDGDTVKFTNLKLLVEDKK